jgi:hypothetical protein
VPGLDGPRRREAARAATGRTGKKKPRILATLKTRKQNGDSVRKIAAQFGVDPSAIQRISRPLYGAWPHEAMSHEWTAFAARRGNLSLLTIRLAPQTYHHVDADDLVTIRWNWSFADDHIGRRHIH